MNQPQTHAMPEPYKAPPTIQRIPTEGARITQPRNSPRIVLEVETAVPGQTPEGHYVKVDIDEDGTRRLTTSRIEIYLDRLGNFMRDWYRTPAMIAAWEDAERIANVHIEQWKMENKGSMKRMSAEERAAHIHLRCNIRPGTYLSGLGYPTGIKNITSVKLVSQQDDDKTCDVHDFIAKTDKGEYLMNADERSEFIGSAPRTEDNALDKSGAMIAAVLERALAGAAKKR